MPAELPETLWGPLWRHMHSEHGLILLDDECNQIAQACDEARMAAGTPVAMILINALRSLSQDELVTLGKAIAERCEHTFEPRPSGSDAPTCSASSLTGEQIEILKHTVKNGRYCGGGKDTEALAAAGLMHYLGTPAWCPDPFYAITAAGQAAIRGQNSVVEPLPKNSPA